MSAGVVLQFEGVGEDQYNAVNSILGIDMSTGEGDWPAGLQYHGGGPSDDGGWVVMEVWESREAQGAFMESRLGAALGQVGLPEPRVVWSDLVASHLLGG